MASGSDKIGEAPAGQLAIAGAFTCETYSIQTSGSSWRRFPPYVLDGDTIEQVQREAQLREPSLLAETDGVLREQLTIHGAGDERPVECLYYRPALSAKRLRGAVLHLHGGGCILGSARRGDARNQTIVREHNIVVVSVNYRLAPQDPYPAAVSDCLTFWNWMIENAVTLGIGPGKIGVIGESAGGGLAATLVHHLCDEGKHPPVAQLLVYPMLDDRTVGANSLGIEEESRVRTAAHNRYAWRAYLGDTPPDAIPVPGRRDHLHSLPPTWLAVGSLDLFLEENLTYARRSIACGVAAELHVYSQACHGFVTVANAAVTRQFHREFIVGDRTSCGPRVS